MLVYRFEIFEEGLDGSTESTGIYQIDDDDIIDVYGCWRKWEEIEPNHPTPDEDDLMATPWHRLYKKGDHFPYRFGFSSIEQMLAWFPKNICLKFLEANILISIYKVRKTLVVDGIYQCAFYYDKAQLVGSLKREDFERL